MRGKGIIGLQRRLTEIGRIRIGQKGAKGQPQKLTTFRLTSFDKRAIDAAAALWGGEAKVCTEPDLKGQYEVITNTSEIPFIVSPVEPSQSMELWSGGGCLRRCDGEKCMLAHDGELEEVPCQCDPDEPECKPHTRLSVMLPDLPGFGVWRLETKGWNAANELITAYEFLLGLTRNREYKEAMLGLEERKSKVHIKGKLTTTRYMVPVIRLQDTARALISTTQIAGLTANTQTGEVQENAPLLPGATHSEQSGQATHTDGNHVLHDPNPRGKVFALLKELGLPPHEGEHKAMYYTVFGVLLRKEIASLSADVDQAQWNWLAGWFQKLKDGKVTMPAVFRTWLEQNPPQQAVDEAINAEFTSESEHEDAGGYDPVNDHFGYGEHAGSEDLFDEGVV